MQSFDLVAGELASRAFGESAELDWAEANAPQGDHVVADRLGHAAHLAVPTLS
jgi:hypothetical protein